MQYAHAQCAFIHTRVGPRTTSQPPLGKKYHVSTKSTTSFDTYTTFKNAHYFSNHTTSPSKTPPLSRNVHHPSITSITSTSQNHHVLMKITTSYPFANFGGDHLPYAIRTHFLFGYPVLILGKHFFIWVPSSHFGYTNKKVCTQNENSAASTDAGESIHMPWGLETEMTCGLNACETMIWSLTNTISSTSNRLQN